MPQIDLSLDAFVFKSTLFPPDDTKFRNNPDLLLSNIDSLVGNMKLSKNIVNSINEKTIISFVIPIYNCINNFNSDDFVKRKIRQLKWLFMDNPNIVWKLYFVDYNKGSCGSILENELWDYKHNLCYEIVYSNTKTEGGLINYGMEAAVLEYVQYHKFTKHILVCADVDMDIHLSQIGLMLSGLLDVKYGMVVENKFSKISEHEKTIKDICFPQLKHFNSKGLFVMTGNLFGNGSEATTKFALNTDFLLKTLKYGEISSQRLISENNFSNSVKKVKVDNLSTILKIFTKLLEKYPR